LAVLTPLRRHPGVHFLRSHGTDARIKSGHDDAEGWCRLMAVPPRVLCHYGSDFIKRGSMRLPCAFVLATFLWVLPSALGGDRAAAFAQLIRPSAPARVLEAKLLCGMFDGSFTCKVAPGIVAPHGKNVIPGARREVPDTSSQGNTGGGGEQDTTAPLSGESDTGVAAQPPPVAPKTCPANSELLGGHCVRYSQTCRSGLAASVNPQPCRTVEEKLVCNYRQDGLKDCCCRLYDKF
jgi:hypothetical protein